MAPTLLRPLATAQIVLASASPRRAQLLEQLGLSFRVDASGIDERVEPGLSPEAVVEQLACAKALDVASRHPEADLVIGADTIVVRDQTILGKPASADEAIAMLRTLSDRWHQVFTGYALVAPDGRVERGHARTDVYIRALTDHEIERYVATGEPLDKAGSYAIQERGALFVREFRGDYTNVVGLPLFSLDAAWRALGWSAL